MDYLELVKRTDNIFAGKLQSPVQELFEKKIESERIGILKSYLLFDYRVWKAKQLGFVQFDIIKLINLLYGENPNDSELKDKVFYEWVYNHHKNRAEKRHWVHATEVFSHYRQYGFWHWPPYERKFAWSCQMANLNGIKSEVNSYIMLKILQVQSLGIFNVFHVLEPIEPKFTPILLGTIWELPPLYKNGKIVYNNTGNAAHYFLSEWYENG